MMVLSEIIVFSLCCGQSLISGLISGVKVAAGWRSLVSQPVGGCMVGGVVNSEGCAFRYIVALTEELQGWLCQPNRSN